MKYDEMRQNKTTQNKTKLNRSSGCHNWCINIENCHAINGRNNCRDNSRNIPLCRGYRGQS